MIYSADTVVWDRRGVLFRASENADQTELSALLNGVAPVDSGIQDDVISDEHHADLPTHDYTWEAEEEALDFVTGPVIEEINRRAAISSDAYPFSINLSALKHKASKTNVYEFCLLTTLIDKRSNTFREAAVLFEYISSEAVRLFLGGHAKSIRCGWPRQEPEPIPFKEMIAHINSACGELIWSPRIPIPEADAPSFVKDEGLDFVAWKCFQDKRLGQLFILGQCACGGDWEDKLADLSVERLNEYINPVSYVKFTPAFSVPRHVPGHYIIASLSAKVGLVLDRARISLLCERSHDQFNALYGEKVAAITKRMLEELK